ncbi:MAG: hypothetical protein ACWA5T_03470 [Parvularcula sp.]
MPSKAQTHQIPLPFGGDLPDLPFQIGPYNAAMVERARGLVDRPPVAGSASMLAVIGPSGVGKSRLLHHIGDHHGRTVVRPDANGRVGSLAVPGPILVDDADQADPMALFSLFNAVAREAQPLILAGRETPDQWGAGRTDVPPDLISRLLTIPQGRISWPEEADLVRAICQLLDLAGLRFSAADVAAAISGQLRRRFDAAEAYAAAVIAQSVGDGPFGKGLLKASMADIPLHRL